MTAPRYQDIAAGDIPEVIDDDGTRVRVIVGNFWGKQARRGSGGGPAASTCRWRLGTRKRLAVETSRHAFAYVFAGRDLATPAAARRPHRGRRRHRRGDANGPATASPVLFDSGDEVVVQAGDEGIRFPLVSGKPIEEPVACMPGRL